MIRRWDANNNIVTVWDHKYCTTAAYTNSSTKQQRVVELAQAEGLLDLRTVPFDAEATWADIATVHDPAYVQAVRKGHPRRLAQSQGFTWSPAFAESVARIWNGQKAACRLALREGLVLHPVSGAHHAGHSGGGGFCTFNFLVGAARALVRGGVSSVAILDCDAHYGNGTVSLVTPSDRIAIFDISGGAWSNSPTAEQDEFYEVANRTEYHAALNRLPAFLDRVRPALALYQAGVDPFEEDPVGGIDGVGEAFLRFRDQFVIGHLHHRGIPVVVNLAGGYVEGISEQMHVQTIRVAAETLRRHRTRELCRFDPAIGTLTDDALHAELLGDDTAEWDLDLTPCESMTNEEIDRHLEEHAKKHYGRDANRKPDGQ